MPDFKDGNGFEAFEDPDIQVFPIEDSIDLHTFAPRDTPDILEEYFHACREKGLIEVRVIHGKGSGQLRARVESCLKKDPGVESFTTAPPEQGGWGATIVRLFPGHNR